MQTLYEEHKIGQNMLDEILSKILGRKYYLNVVNDGYKDMVSSIIFDSKEKAMEHKISLRDSRSIKYVSTVSFRTHRLIDMEESNNL